MDCYGMVSAGFHHAGQHELAPDPARLERATTLTDCGPLPLRLRVATRRSRHCCSLQAHPAARGDGGRQAGIAKPLA